MRKPWYHPDDPDNPYPGCPSCEGFEDGPCTCDARASVDPDDFEPSDHEIGQFEGP